MAAVIHVMSFSDKPGRGVFSGAENHLFDLMRGQRDRGLQPSLAMLNFRPGPRLSAKAAQLRDEGFEVFELSAPLSWRPIRDRYFRRSLRKLFQSRPESIVHTHIEHADYLGKLAAGDAGCRQVVTTIHNDAPKYAIDPWRGRYQKTDPVTSRYIAITDSVGKFAIEKIGLPAEKIVTVRHGIPEPKLIRGRNEVRDELGLPRDGFIVGFVGRMTAQKNLPTLLDAMKELPTFHAVLIGSGKEEDSLKAHRDRLGLKNVHFLGQRDGAADLMPGFDILCLPSTWEGFGIVLLEAMFRNVPIIGSTGGAIPEVLGDGRFGRVVDCSSADNLAAAIRDAAADPQAMLDLAEQALGHAREQYSLTAMLDGTLSVYRDAQADGPAHSQDVAA
ncbi:glycosyltransferase family 4 protein [Stratiformator vulcanicus]|uniref:GDP-mannose-dependent alpha-(1-2)-phosphatidylinositol mannosyltransferase n=1 Tax=Stratiformator vulcanicus TaxID=2527980 RepID=A0A517R4U0_9PLAN|nr:glycosyltransferase family 4 protein [Stratiformator vulcanicus]QDT38898.1 GDP-mannose-dependent alpha-(1-2)-phosphatidylinositol mannosyltransferase [Stratiformator vulcanicus]